MSFSGKKIFLFGFLAVLVIGIPATVYLVQQQQQQDLRSRAEKSTTLSFTPESSEATPLEKQINDPVSVDVMVDPGKNLVSFVKLEIQYDPEKLATTGATTFQPNTVAFPTVLEGPIYSPGKIAITLSVGPDPTKAIQQVVKAGTLNLKAIANTDAGTPTLITYGTTTQVLSIGASDEASENVLASTVPAAITIGGSSTEPTQSIPTGSPTPGPTSAPTNTPAPTSPPGGTEPTVAPTIGGTGGGEPNESPFCSSLVVDREGNGVAPFSITFTANGSDSDGTITKVSFNFGDGQVEDVTTAGGIGTDQINVQIAHAYDNPGTYQAHAVLTDDRNGSSSVNECVQSIVVTEGTKGTGGGTTTTGTTSASATPSIPPTGTTDVAFGIGAIAIALFTIGGVLFFFL